MSPFACLHMPPNCITETYLWIERKLEEQATIGEALPQMNIFLFLQDGTTKGKSSHFILEASLKCKHHRILKYELKELSRLPLGIYFHV